MPVTGALASPSEHARQVHARLLKLDGHLDAPIHFMRQGWSIGERHDLSTDVAQLDFPRMEDGNLNGGFFVIYTPQGPLTPTDYDRVFADACRRSEEIDATLAAFPDRIGLALTAQDTERLHAQNRLICFKSIENSYPIGDDVTRVETFYKLGVRLAGPVHSRTNQLADSATDAPRWGGLSPLGKEWLGAMNRLGMMIDPSHASDAAFDDMLSLSRAPLLLSHSGSRSVFDTERNLDDGRLRALAQTGGVLCFTTIYLSDLHMTPERGALMRKLGLIHRLTPDEQAALARDWNALDAAEPMWTAGLDQFMAGLLHVIDVAGIDHVAFSGDFDGGGGIDGLADVTDLPVITERLIEAGLDEADLAKLWGQNILRVLRDNEAAARP